MQRNKIKLSLRDKEIVVRDFSTPPEGRGSPPLRSGESAPEKVSEPLHPQTTSTEQSTLYDLKVQTQEGEQKILEAWAADRGHSQIPWTFWTPTWAEKL